MINEALLAVIGKTAKVHWNLQKKAYSISVGGKVAGYVSAVTLEDCVFVIDRRLRRMFEENPNRRTVHALVKGRIASYEAIAVQGERVRCNPFRFNSFVLDDERAADSAALVVLHPDKRIEALGVLVAAAIH